MLPFPWLPLATNELVPGFCHRSLLYHLKPFPEMVITIKVGPCRAYSFGLCSITERSNDGARPTNIRGRCSSQARTLSLGARTSGPHLVGASVLPTARDRRTSGAAARPKPARFPWERGPLARIWWEQAFSRRRETDEHQGPLLVPNPHASPESAGLWPASGGSKRSPDGARPTNIRGRCSSQTRTLPLGARTSGPHLVGSTVLLGLKSFPVPAS